MHQLRVVDVPLVVCSRSSSICTTCHPARVFFLFVTKTGNLHHCICTVCMILTQPLFLTPLYSREQGCLLLSRPIEKPSVSTAVPPTTPPLFTGCRRQFCRDIADAYKTHIKHSKSRLLLLLQSFYCYCCSSWLHMCFAYYQLLR